MTSNRILTISYFMSVFSIVLILNCGTSENAREEQTETSMPSIFSDITEQVNLHFVHDPGVDGSYYMPESLGSGGALFDYDNDGDLDIYLINSGQHNDSNPASQPAGNRLFRQENDGTFVDATESSGLGDTGYGMGIAVGDVENDGDLDVYVSNVGPDVLYRNDGDGTFTDISRLAGITNPEWGCSIVFFDYDLDGYLDIYVTNYVNFDPLVICTDRAGRPDYCGPRSFPGEPDVLYHNDGRGAFTDVSISSGITKGSSKGLGVVSADFNNDEFPDLYVANDGEPNHLWINQGNGKFQDQALRFGVAFNEIGRAEASMGIAVGDIDSDGDLDLFMTHLREESNTFYRNSGRYGFLDDTSLSGLGGLSLVYTGFGTGFFDFDHDTDLDLAIVDGRVTRGPLLTNNERRDYWDNYAEPNFLLENDGTGRFRNVSHLAKEFTSKTENSRGLAFGDIDNDGDIDLLVTNEGGSARLYRNDVKDKGHWLIIRALDANLNRDAIGASITVYVGARQIHRIVTPAYSYLSSSDPRMHFGLGVATSVDKILVKWPGGKTEAYPGVEADQIITIRSGQQIHQK